MLQASKVGLIAAPVAARGYFSQLALWVSES